MVQIFAFHYGNEMEGTRLTILMIFDVVLIDYVLYFIFEEYY